MPMPTKRICADRLPKTDLTTYKIDPKDMRSIAG